MAKVTLRSYVREIEALIEQDQRLEDAISHCRHILRTYPKHLESYRLLGKAYLEGKRYDQAVDIFERVLMAVPSDFVSHVGMSIIADDQGKLDDAIWHMERAFEVQPANAAIQGELQRLFGRRDGVEPPKIRLTRGALAHMYVQGQLFTQAISEIRAVLAQDPKRTDLEVLLAEAYFRNGQKSDAAQACSDLLMRSPYCLEANRLMAEMVAGGQSPSEAAEYRERVEELDPYAAFAPDSPSHTEAVPDSAILIERLDSTGRAPDSGFSLSLGTSAAALGASMGTALRPEVPKPRDASPEPEADVPEFLRDAGWKLAADAETGPDESGGDAESSEAALPGELPDWVRALAPSDASQGTEADSRLEPLGSDSAGVGATLPPAWLGEQGHAPADEGSEIPQPAASAADASDPAGTQEGGPAKGAAGAPADSLSWLEGLSSEDNASAESSPEDRDQGGAVPDWASTPAPFDRASVERWGSSSEGAEDSDRPAAEVPGTQSKTAGENQGSAQSLDWLRNLSQDDTYSRMEDASAGAEDQGTANEPAEFGGGPPKASAGEQPDWLDSEAVKTGRTAAGGQESGNPDGGSSLPEWLANLDKAEPEPVEETGPELPDWLRAGPESPPEDAERILPNDWQPMQEPVEQAGPQPGASGVRAGASETQHAPDQVKARPAAPSTVKAKPLSRPTKPGDATLGGAQSELGRGNIAAALDMYGRLIHKGKSIEEIIRDLRDALYRYPVEVPLWQALGDAYMRANRLQEALDAYTKAEELLR
jgi:cytochrome c-type biogenesis protein CcmH/NrfG